MFCKKGVLKKFRKFHRKEHVLESLFNKAGDTQTGNFIKRLQYLSFCVIFSKFLGKSNLKNICDRLLLEVWFLFIPVMDINKSYLQKVAQTIQNFIWKYWGWLIFLYSNQVCSVQINLKEKKSLITSIVLLYLVLRTLFKSSTKLIE